MAALISFRRQALQPTQRRPARPILGKANPGRLADGLGAVGPRACCLPVIDHRVVPVALACLNATGGLAADRLMIRPTNTWLFSRCEERAASILSFSWASRQAELPGRPSAWMGRDVQILILGSVSAITAVQAVISDCQSVCRCAPAAASGEQAYSGLRPAPGCSSLSGSVSGLTPRPAVTGAAATIFVPRRPPGGEARDRFHAQPFGWASFQRQRLPRDDSCPAVHGPGTGQGWGNPGSALGAFQDVDVVAGHRGIERR